MTLHPQGPKPTKRVRARKPIARKSKPGRVRKTSAGAKARTADRLFSLIVRAEGDCRYHGKESPSDPWGGGCTVGLQCAHVVSRSYRSVRWSEDNAMPLCARAHVYFTHHPLEWEQFVIEEKGAADFEALKIRALKPWDHDIDGVLVRLAARAVTLGIKPEGK